MEDNKGDVLLMQFGFSAAGIPWNCTVVHDGQAAMDYLTKALEAGTLPSYLLLDLKLPRRDGLEVLAWVRALQELSSLRVIDLTSSNLDTDRSQAERFGIDAYLVKPDTTRDYRETALRIAEIWGLPRG